MRSINVFASLLAFAALFLTGSSAVGAEPVVTSISVIHEGDHWRVEYTFDEPILAINFGPEVMGLRSERWQVLTPGLVMVTENEEDRLESQLPFDRASLEIHPHDVFPPKNYVPTSSYSDGGSTLFLGFLMGDLVNAEGQSTLMDFTFDLQARPGEFALMPEQALSGYRVFAYFGPRKPVAAGFARLLIDPHTPAWLREEIMTLVPAVTELLATELNFDLPQKPLIMIGAGQLEAFDGFSIKGGAINGHIMMSLRGKSLHDEKNRARFQRLLTHEIAHLWQDGPGTTPLQHIDPWLHEGGADALALAALEKLGLWDANAVGQYRERAISACEEGIGDQTLREAAASGQWGLMYSCGLRMFVDSGLRALPLYSALIAEAVATGAPCSQALFDRIITSGLRPE